MSGKYIVSLLVLVVCFSGTKVMAAAIGMPVQTARLGLAVGSIHLSVDDPAGSTESVWAVSPLSIIYSDRLMTDVRFWGEAFYQEAVLSPSSSQIGQLVRQLGVRISLQHSIDMKILSPWLGVGLQLSNNRFQNRHTVDDEGYLLESFYDRTETQASLLLNMVIERHLAHGWDLGAKIEQSVSLSDDIENTSISMVLLYNY